MKKKWIMIILASSLVITLLGVFTVLTLENKPVENPEIQVISELKRELGSEVPTLKDFGIEEEGTIEFYLQGEKIENIDTSKQNTYQVKITVKEKEYTFTLKIESTIPPEVTLKELTIEKGATYTPQDFIESCKAEFSTCHYSFESEEMGNYKDAGTYQIVIVIEDENKNITRKESKLTITEPPKEEQTPPQNNTPNNNNNSNNSNSNPQNSNNNSTSSKEETPTPTPPKEPTKTFTEKKDEVTTKVEKKYGATITYTTTTTYNYYSDGTKEKVGENTTTKIDTSTFNGTTSEMKPEATTLYKQNVNELKQVLEYVNRYRSEVSASPLVLDETLSILATVRAIEMGWSDNFSHTRPNGQVCFQILDEEKIQYWNVGENIASGYANAAAVSEGWRKSKGHYENMISTKFGRIGIGKAIVNGKPYWVQIFTN